LKDDRDEQFINSSKYFSEQLLNNIIKKKHRCKEQNVLNIYPHEKPIYIHQHVRKKKLLRSLNGSFATRKSLLDYTNSKATQLFRSAKCPMKWVEEEVIWLILLIQSNEKCKDGN
jgi:hypothetical protein